MAEIKDPFFFPEWRSPDYYFFPDDVRKYPDAWLYVVWSRRGPGKTYSFLRSMYENDIKFAYMKRTIKDVGFICSNKFGFDLSPFVPVNRDTGSTIKPQLINDGIGAFYAAEDEHGDPAGVPFGYCLALNAIKEIKGMELSDVDYICLDEFIPQPGERVIRSEGELLLSVYMTVQRDRIKRGKDPVKLVLFSNADAISTPITNEIEIVDSMADLQASGKTHLYDPERGILLHHITEDEVPLYEEEKSGIYKAMSRTAWGRKTFDGVFASNDFSNVGRVQMKGYKPVTRYLYRNKIAYVYRNGADYYITYSKHQDRRLYDLERENDQKAFYSDYVIDLRVACIEGHLKTEAYSMYDLVWNYKKIFRIT